MRLLTYVCLALVASGAFGCWPQYQEGLTNFLSEKMANYGAWLKENDYDPTPPVIDDWLQLESEDRDRTVFVSLILSKVFLSGISNTTTPPCGYGIFDSQYFNVERNYSLTYEGDYSCVGIITEGNGSSVHFAGRGQFKLPQKNMRESYRNSIEDSNFQQFQEVNGFWNITTPGRAHRYSIRSLTDVDRMEFDGLFNEDDISLYVPQIKAELASVFDKYTARNWYEDEDHVLARHLEEYLAAAFLATPLDQIRNWTRAEQS